MGKLSIKLFAWSAFFAFLSHFTSLEEMLNDWLVVAAWAMMIASGAIGFAWLMRATEG